MTRNIWLAGAARILALVIVLCAVGSSMAADNNPWRSGYFPSVTLLTQDGKAVKFYDDLLKDKIVIINFIYTSCGDSCPLETAKLAQVAKLLGDKMGKEIFIYSISIDPKHDTPAVLKEYTEKFHVGNGWYFLTGKKQDIDLIRAKLGQAARPNADPLTGHSTSLTLGNESTGQWMQDSSLDHPKYIAAMAGDWLTSWKDHKRANNYAEVPKIAPTETDRGAYLFRTRCSACHTVGKGDTIGPDLKGVTDVREQAWLERFISTPDKMVASGDPIATALFEKYKKVKMPNLRLEGPDVAALIAYLKAQSAAPASRASADASMHEHHHHEIGNE